ncbi:hypothetical protein ACIP6X_34685 [Streptomyces coeruleorubidus]|uniref:hypothetical protein n=1 Tax=Streptomyces coeruleorubidus TaxID=116188 RepID=UPI003826AEBE
MIVGSIPSPINSSMLAVALIPIGRAFDVPPTRSAIRRTTAIGVTALTRRRSRVRGKLVVGALFQCLGCAALSLLRADSPLWLLIALSAVVGIPHGLIGLANQHTPFAQADPARIGSSAGLRRTFMYIGALFAAVATAAFFRYGATSSGLHGMAWVLVGVAAVFLVLCAADRSQGCVGTPPDASG